MTEHTPTLTLAERLAFGEEIPFGEYDGLYETYSLDGEYDATSMGSYEGHYRIRFAAGSTLPTRGTALSASVGYEYLRVLVTGNFSHPLHGEWIEFAVALSPREHRESIQTPIEPTQFPNDFDFSEIR